MTIDYRIIGAIFSGFLSLIVAGITTYELWGIKLQ
jgi:hypothetical protein